MYLNISYGVLNMHGQQIPDNKMNEFIDFIKYYSFGCYVGSCVTLDENNLKSVLKLFTQKEVRRISMDYCGFTDIQGQCIFDIYKDVKSMKYFDIAGNKFSDSMIAKLALIPGFECQKK
jgi:hypothetical protein